MPAGTSPEGLWCAAEQFLREQFTAKHRYGFVLHTDKPHPHVHAVIKATSEQGMRLRIDKRTLRQWREQFAQHLRAVGIETNATGRAVRGQSVASKPDAIFRAARRGASTHIHRRMREVLTELSRGGIREEAGRARLLGTRRKVEAGWLVLSRLLLAEGKGALAAEVCRFVERMPPAKTDKERLADPVLSRMHAIRSKAPPTR